MKKIIYVAVFTVVCFAMTSCDKESLESVALQSDKLEKGDGGHVAKPGDSIVVQNLTTDEPGPGDEVVPIKPPKP